MLHIIGTAGHVDHGKTALIEALTGINADRLPEEKERGMTIDLGFAHFKGPEGQPVGVIDVPGHERFIRNMVAGAWSLSCAVLVVAGDDGWMQQSEDHARVLEAMGIHEIICALTKTDVIENEILSLVTDDVREQLLRIFNKKIPVIPVSSITGYGIEKLRASILKLLGSLQEQQSLRSGFFHIDRVFTIKGSGTIVTGSLSGGELSVGNELTILPEGLKSKIRGIQSYYSSVDTAFPVSRIACNIPGIKKEEVSRGCVAALNAEDFKCAKEFIIQWEPLTDNSIRNHMELEIAFGAGHYIGILHFFEVPGFARIILQNEAAAAWLDPCLLIRHGGSAILGKGRFIWAGKTDRQFRKHLSSVLRRYKFPETINTEHIFQFVLKGWRECAAESEKQDIEKFASAEKLRIRITDHSIILEERLQEELNQLKLITSKQGGVNTAEYFQSSKLPQTLKDFVVHEALTTKMITQKDQILISPEQLRQDAELSPLAQRILVMLQSNEKEGIELKNITEAGAQTELRNLVRMGKIVSLEGGIYYTTKTFRKLADRILSGLPSGSSFSIPEAKEKTGLSRKYIIPLLNKMEEKGMVKRDDNVRIVC